MIPAEITGPIPGMDINTFDRSSAWAVISKINLFVDSTETQAVSNDEGVHIMILGQVIVCLFEFTDLLRIEDMNL